MASLREIKGRISSVRTTRKITQARQMVSSAHLHRAQADMAAARAYRDALEDIVDKAGGPAAPYSPLYGERDSGGVAVVVMSANGGMCGSFNARIIRELPKIAEKYGKDAVFYPVGAKVREAAAAAGYAAESGFDDLADGAPFGEVAALAGRLTGEFLAGKLRHVEVVYYDFKSVGSQQIVYETLLPLAPLSGDPVVGDYIVEPDPEELASALFPMLVCARFYSFVTSNRTSEHAVRMVAMQLATENADNLLDDLQLAYNKLRQQNITAELLDIIGSSFA